MNKILKVLVYTLLVLAVFSACKKEVKKQDPGIQLAKDTLAIKSYVAVNGLSDVKQYSNSGIYYKIIEPGTGTGTYTFSSVMKVNYTGRLLDGTVFDKTTGTPFVFSFGQVISGWQAITTINKGGKIRLFIPSLYGYKTVPNGSIPANSVLDFDIELVDVQY